MINWWKKRQAAKYFKRTKTIDPDEIFIDSSNLPNFDVHQFEGRLEKPISRRSLVILVATLIIIIIVFTIRVGELQLVKGDYYLTKSENNRLRNSLVFAKRGVVYDRLGTKLAWNIENPEPGSFDLRQYLSLDGLAHLLGYVKYPSKDKSGFYWSETFDGKAGIEKIYNVPLSGTNGKQIVEVDARDKVQSQNVVRRAKEGENLTLTIDVAWQNKLYSEIKELANAVGFVGGTGIVMNVKNGEILVLTSYPEYNSQVLTDGENRSLINNYLSNKNNPFLNRAIDGLYTPGSTVKPFIAYAALQEKVIDPYTNIYSSGILSVPNPYNPDKPTIFRDWKAHGYVDMKKALAVSSDIYFYEVGGGFEGQKGLGIATIDKYLQLFGFGQSIESDFFQTMPGTIPTPAWKAENFDGEAWLLGNTYHTAIGQYGFQITPFHLLRAVAALANGGQLVTPKIILNQPDGPKVDLGLDQANLKIVRDGMRDGVVKDYGVARGLNSPNYSIAAKTGTAELGLSKKFVNSWISGFFPYENPEYAFVVIMEKGPVENTMGALSALRQTLDWLTVERPEYLK